MEMDDSQDPQYPYGGEEDQLGEGSGSNRSFGGCTSCRKSKVKCGEEKPTCSRCIRRRTECEYPDRPTYPAGRIRRFHRRSTAGCTTCRSRRVKCDEVGPTCGPCARRGCPCVFPKGIIPGGENDYPIADQDPSGSTLPTETPSRSRKRAKHNATTSSSIKEEQPPQPNQSMSILDPSGLEFPYQVYPPPFSSGSLPPLENFVPPVIDLNQPQYYQSSDDYAVQGLGIPTSSERRPHFYDPNLNPGDDRPFTTLQEQEGLAQVENRSFDSSAAVQSLDRPQWEYDQLAPIIQQAVTQYEAVDQSALIDPTLQHVIPEVKSNEQATSNRTGAAPESQRNMSSINGALAEMSAETRATVESLGMLANGSTHGHRDESEVSEEGAIVRQTGPSATESAHRSELGGFLPSESSLDQLSTRQSYNGYPAEVIRPQTFRSNNALKRPRTKRDLLTYGSASGGYVPTFVPTSILPTDTIPPSFTRSLHLNPNLLAELSDFQLGHYGSQLVHMEHMTVSTNQAPDPLSVWFPLSRERILYRHFVASLADTMIAMPNHKHLNPWKIHFAKLALGKPPGQDLGHDVFRKALLSLSAYDLGYRIATSSGIALEEVYHSPVVHFSEGLRNEAGQMLEAAVVDKRLQQNSSSVDLVLGACISCSFRDRFAASSIWTQSIDIASTIMQQSGGTLSFLRLSSNLARRFMLEQLACIDLFASFLKIDTPLIMPAESVWWDEQYGARTPRSLREHVEIVYGLDRDMVNYLARVLHIVCDGRNIALKRAGLPGSGLDHVPEVEMNRRWGEFLRKSRSLDEECEKIALETHLRPYPERIAAGRIMWQSAVVIWLGTDKENTKAQIARVSRSVSRIFEITTEALERGMVTHLLLPFVFGSYLTTGTGRDEVERLIQLIRPYLRMDWVTVTSYIRRVWSVFDSPNQVVSLMNWRQHYQDLGLSLPVI